MANGLLSYYDLDPEGRARADLEFEEFRKREADEAAKAAEVAAHEAEVQEVYDKLEATFVPFLHEEATAVNAQTRIKPADRKVFKERLFKKSN
jgi:hypothetical protein